MPEAGDRLAPASLYVHERASVLIPLPFLDIASEVTVAGLTWHRKHEFHVTAANTASIAERIRERRGLAEEEAEAAAWQAVRETATEASVGAVTLSDQSFAVRRDEERTLIRLCEVEGLDEFFAAISSRLGTPIEPPPAHLTLYTAPGGEAIGLHTQEDLERDAAALDPAAAAELRRAVEHGRSRV